MFPSLFDKVNVDNKKYESLLADLKAHDLLGPDINLSYEEQQIDQFDLNFDDLDICFDNIPLVSAAKPTINKPPPGFEENNTRSDNNIFGFSNGFSMMGSISSLKPYDEIQYNNHADEDDIWNEFDNKHLVNIQSLGLDEDDNLNENEIILTKNDLPSNNNIQINVPPKIQILQRKNALLKGANRELSRKKVNTPSPYTGGKYMTPNDIKFVLQQQMKQIRSSDPFSDDYYYYCFIQNEIRTKSHNESTKTSIPLPSWQLQHVRSLDPRDDQRAKKAREWESQNQVLGRNNRTSLYCPREIITLEKSTGIGIGIWTKTSFLKSTTTIAFNETRWINRSKVDIAIRCLLSLQDARHILEARGLDVVEFRKQDIKTLDTPLIQLRSQMNKISLQLSCILGIILEDNVYKADWIIAEGLLSSDKGKKLVARSLPVLLPSARFLLLPSLFSYILLNYNANTDSEADKRLCEAIIIVIMYHPPIPPANVFADCLEKALCSHDINSLSQLLHNKTRAEVLQALLQQGGPLCNDANAPIKGKWLKWQEKFVNMATTIKKNSML